MMKNNNKIYALIAFLLVLFFSSCLKKDLPKLPLWDGNSIVNVYVEARYNSPDQVYQGSPVVMYQRLTTTVAIDTLNNTVNLDIVVPDVSTTFPQSARDAVSQTKLWMFADLSTAAQITPIEGSTKLGDQVDLTKPQKYRVVAANGNGRDWTITVSKFTK